MKRGEGSYDRLNEEDFEDAYLFLVWCKEGLFVLRYGMDEEPSERKGSFLVPFLFFLGVSP